MRAPFRATVRGTIWGLQSLDATQQGIPKRTFRLVDPNGSYLLCCALAHNASSEALVAEQEVVAYYATARSPIRSAPSMLYFMKDSVIPPLGFNNATQGLSAAVDIM